MRERNRLAMTDAELQRFLAEVSVAEVAGSAAGRLVARRARVLEAGDELVLELDPAERCFDLDTDDRVCVITDRYPDHASIRGVVMGGQGRWQGELLRVTVETVTSFDFTKAG